jgi:hypothetical protein
MRRRCCRSRMKDSPVLTSACFLSCKSFPPTQRTCLSFRPMRIISSMSVSFGCLLRSALSLMSRGSNAILWPFSEFSYAVSGVRSSLRFGAGELTRLPSSSPLPAAPPPPLRRVRPELEAIARGCGTGGMMRRWLYWRRSSMSTEMQALGLRRRGTAGRRKSKAQGCLASVGVGVLACELWCCLCGRVWCDSTAISGRDSPVKVRACHAKLRHAVPPVKEDPTASKMSTEHLKPIEKWIA